MTLYEITSDLLAVQNTLLDTGELTPEDECRLDQLGETLGEKVDAICKVIAQLDGEADMAEQERNRLGALISARTNAAARLKGYLKSQFERLDVKKLSTPLFTVSLCKNATPSVDVEPERIADLPAEFLRTKVEPNKIEIGRAWKDGRDLPDFVRVEVGTNLRIK